jgi:hypothetical protein
MKIEVNLPDTIEETFTEKRIRMSLACFLNEKEILDISESIKSVGIDFNDFLTETAWYNNLIYNSKEKELEKELEIGKRFCYR